MKRILSIILAVVTLLGALAFAVTAQEPAPDVSPYTVVDGDTRYEYQKIFDLDHTRFDGRIWTDKTVSDTALEYHGNVREYVSLAENGNITSSSGDEETEGVRKVTIEKEKDEDFLVSYSAIASSTNVISQESAPLDLVLVLDLSPEMGENQEDLESMLAAAQSAINATLEANENNRAAVLGYSSEPLTLIPLGHYQSVSFTYSDTITADDLPSDENTKKPEYFYGYVQGVYDGKTSDKFPIYKTAEDQIKDGLIEKFDKYETVNKYTQLALFEGMRLLAETTNMSVQIGESGEKIQRQPALILLSEDAPVIASTQLANPSWPKATIYGYADANRKGVEIQRNQDENNLKANPDHRHAQTFATLLTAAYMKKQVADHYSVENATTEEEGKRDMRIYTVGVNIADADAESLAEMSLNPSANLDNDTTFAGYAESYFGSKGRAELPNAGANNMTTAFIRDTDSLGLAGAEDLKYNDGYYEAFTAGGSIDWSAIFETVFANVSSTTAKVPIKQDETGTFGDGSGYLSYTDPLGDYMEVKKFRGLIINDILYRTCDEGRETSEGNTTTTTYTFTGTANNPVTGSHNLSEIKIYVESTPVEGENGIVKQTVHVDIPAGLVPLRVTDILLNEEDQAIEYGHNSICPFRLIYSVGLQDGVLDQDGAVNMDKVSDEYIAANTGENGVMFYEGQYDAETKPDGNNLKKTVGSAYVTYTPAADNPFYYVDSDTYLYTDANCQSHATGAIDHNAAYYFPITYYQKSENIGYAAVPVTVNVVRPGSSLQGGYVKADGSGNLYLEEGQPRLGNLTDFLKEKQGYANTDNENIPANATNTAQIYLYLEYTGNRANNPGESAINDTFKVYHGNNGIRAVPLPDGTLTITKKVVNGERAEISEFEFTIALTGASLDEIKTDYPDIKWDYDNTGGTAGTDIPLTGTFQLGNGESKVLSLENGIDWTVTENTIAEDNNGTWTAEVAVNGEKLINAEGEISASGTIGVDESTKVVFTNIFTHNKGDLIVYKQLGQSSEPGADRQSFQFTLRKDDGTRIGTFFLAPEQSADLYEIFADLEPGGYTVTEEELSKNWTPVSFVTSAEDDTAQTGNVAHVTITAGETDGVYFTNTYTAPGTLTVTKEVEGGNGDEKFPFTLTVDGKQETFELGNGESKTFTISVGSQWSVTENTPSGWISTVNGAASGTMTKDNRQVLVNFTNTKQETEPAPNPGWGGEETPPALEKDDHIQYLFGYPDRSFGPERNMTRAEAAQMFHNLLEKQDYPITITPFADVAENGWYTRAVKIMASLGVVSGMGDGTFQPNRAITRAEFVSMAVKFLESPQASGQAAFPDVSAEQWFYSAVQAAAQEGWIHGYEDGTFRPEQSITRAEVASIVNHMLERCADQKYAEEYRAKLNTFTDVEPSYWGYYHIVEATNKHDYTKRGQQEIWTGSSYKLR